MILDTTVFPGVELTLWALLLFSALTWLIGIVKSGHHWWARRQNRRYAAAFWSAKNFAEATRLESPNSGLQRIVSGAVRVLRQGTREQPEWNRQEIVERELHRLIQLERSALDKTVTILGSIGSTAPFVGLFGTVWGIMNALTEIGATGNASIEVVAGPIGHALVATGIGIGVAVPAVLIFNYLVRSSKGIIEEAESFISQFLNAAQRTAFLLEEAPALTPAKTEKASVQDEVASAHKNVLKPVSPVRGATA